MLRGPWWTGLITTVVRPVPWWITASGLITTLVRMFHQLQQEVLVARAIAEITHHVRRLLHDTRDASLHAGAAGTAEVTRERHRRRTLIRDFPGQDLCIGIFCAEF